MTAKTEHSTPDFSSIVEHPYTYRDFLLDLQRELDLWHTDTEALAAVSKILDGKLDVECLSQLRGKSWPLHTTQVFIDLHCRGKCLDEEIDVSGWV